MSAYCMYIEYRYRDYVFTLTYQTNKSAILDCHSCLSGCSMKRTFYWENAVFHVSLTCTKFAQILCGGKNVPKYINLYIKHSLRNHLSYFIKHLS